MACTMVQTGGTLQYHLYDLCIKLERTHTMFVSKCLFRVPQVVGVRSRHSMHTTKNCVFKLSIRDNQERHSLFVLSLPHKKTYVVSIIDN